MASVVNDVLAPRLIGRPAADVEALWFELVNWGERHGDQGVFTMGLSGVDLALWDLRGKRAGASICELLGGPVTDSLPAYASLPWLRSADLVLRETTRAVEAGFRAVKLHEIDPDFTALLRREFDDDLTIMVDALQRLMELFFAAGAEFVLPGVHGLPEKISSLEEVSGLDRLRFRPTDFTLAGNHAFGSTRMHGDGRFGVVDEDGRCHDTENLYIADTGVLPRSPSVNPMLTTMALAHRTASRLAERV